VRARCEFNIWEATTLTLGVHWAAVVDATNLASSVELFIVLAMEVIRADRGRRWPTLNARRNLVVDVEVLGAAILTLSIGWSIWQHPLITTTMHGEHIDAIHVAFVRTVSKVVLAMLLAELMVVNFVVFTFIIDGDRGPLAIMVNVLANGGAMLVGALPCNIHTILRSTFIQQLLLGVVVEEDIEVAFDLLGGRPIDLAVLLLTLKVGHIDFILSLTTIVALCETTLADLARLEIPLAHALLERPLNAIALHILIEELAVSFRALSPKFVPNFPFGLVQLDN
jgi:hypothetical protein